MTQTDLGGGLAFSFDDHHLAVWTSLRPTFDRYGAKATFFISAYHTLNDEERGQLRALADDGHDIQYHSTNHENAVEVAESEGVGVWIERDIVPDLAAMRADGYPASTPTPTNPPTSPTSPSRATHPSRDRSCSHPPPRALRSSRSSRTCD